MPNFRDTFETRKGSNINALSNYMTAPLSHRTKLALPYLVSLN